MFIKRIPKEIPIQNKCYDKQLDRADILLVTVTEIETRAVFEAFGIKRVVSKNIADRVYFNLGEVNGAAVMLTRSEMGAAGRGASLQTVQKGIDDLSPAAVVMVGIAFGVNEETQNIGDVLVSERLLLYDLQKVGTGKDGQEKICLRDDKPHASQWLLQLLKSSELTWDRAELRFGTILTGTKLVDNIDFREQLCDFEQNAIGGEMEGAGLYVACEEKKVDWVLVKAICDFADGNKAKNKEERQALAAKNAADFVYYVLQSESIDWGSHRGPATRVDITTKLRNSLTIIIPAFNESRILPDLKKSLRRENFINKYKIIICDDGSFDNSFAIMQECFSGLQSVECIRNKVNSRKVGAIDRMTQMVNTPFVLTLDADCIISELEENALERLMSKMKTENISASCFRIVPNERNWLGRLQKLDYSIFTDSIRKILDVPVCLIGQGVLWRTDSLQQVLLQHSREFHGDDLENTIIALNYKMRIYWERKTVILITNPKRTIMGLLKQRALSWDFGMLRVLFEKRTLRLGGESGAFYKNILLLDVVAHPFKLIAIPMLVSVPVINFLGSAFYESAAYNIYRNSFALSLKYGAFGIVSIWFISLINSLVCVRKPLPTVKLAMFNAIYLSSPFVYVLFYPLLSTSNVNVYDTMGAAIHWLGIGLLLTYLWWVALTLYLLCITSLERRDKMELVSSVLLAPFYYFILLVICKTVGILKFVMHCLLRHKNSKIVD